MPAGYYDALRITIGEAKGKNWWCVMFPPMCLPAAESHSELEKVLDSGEIDMLISGQKYVLEFKAVELYAEFKEWVRKFIYEPSKKMLSGIDFPYDPEFIVFKIFEG